MQMRAQWWALLTRKVSHRAHRGAPQCAIEMWRVIGKTMQKVISAIVLGLILVIGYPTALAAAISPDLAAELEAASPEREIMVIVTLKERVRFADFRHPSRSVRRVRLVQALKAKARQSQRPLREFLLRERIKKSTHLWVINGRALKARPEAIRRLSALPFIESVRLDRVISLGDIVPGVPEEPESNIEIVGAKRLWRLGLRGEGIVVAAMDMGVDPDHPDLTGRWADGGWFDPHGEHPTPFDANGHGTQVMGLLVGGDAGGTAIGMAPGAMWIAVKIFNDAGDAALSDIHQGFQWLLDRQGIDVPHLVNNSWGFDQEWGECFDEFSVDIEALWTAGIAVIFAGGNTGPMSGTSVSPANLPGVLSVGSVNNELAVSLGSSRGPSACDGTVYPKLTAPGVNVKTADLTLGGVIPDPYAWVSGTSFAAAHVAGAMALLIQAFPETSVTDLQQALMETARDLGPSGPDNDYGYGVMDVAAAYYLLAGCTNQCSGDVDGDWDVDGKDLAVFASGEMDPAAAAALAAQFARTDCLACDPR